MEKPLRVYKKGVSHPEALLDVFDKKLGLSGEQANKLIGLMKISLPQGVWGCALVLDAESFGLTLLLLQSDNIGDHVLVGVGLAVLRVKLSLNPPLEDIIEKIRSAVRAYWKDKLEAAQREVSTAQKYLDLLP
ncbi:MAG: hypothetical protein WCV92_01905 [Candidatus Buchananbacteria bacterium]